jgi:hypothetical protein
MVATAAGRDEGTRPPEDLRRAACALGCDARRGEEGRVAPWRRAATPQRAPSTAALRVVAGPGILRVGPRPRAHWHACLGPSRACSGPARNAPRASRRSGPWPGSESRAMRCSSVKRADKARRPASPVPSGAGGSRRMAVLASLERPPAFLRSAVGVPAPQGSLARRVRAGMRCKTRRGRQGGALATSRNAATRPARGVPPGWRVADRLHCCSVSACVSVHTPSPERRESDPATRPTRREPLGGLSPHPAREAPRARPCPILG